MRCAHAQGGHERARLVLISRCTRGLQGGFIRVVVFARLFGLETISCRRYLRCSCSDIGARHRHQWIGRSIGSVSVSFQADGTLSHAADKRHPCTSWTSPFPCRQTTCLRRPPACDCYVPHRWRLSRHQHLLEGDPVEPPWTEHRTRALVQVAHESVHAFADSSATHLGSVPIHGIRHAEIRGPRVRAATVRIPARPGKRLPLPLSAIPARLGTARPHPRRS